ncbi:low molecular weight phosphatase family protein [Abyssibius alkaniclasticus]|uniref:arsenate-mycothiol transferase ArsC n=1 Tax=Abyssibius alkaniclasticus TaxID=2881234 RepID=UPI0023634BDC|nr:low molecular weight phosphatase family protein [Abyssibius alkaniclasticus]UPH70967.1 low molecular weight phosphatase family protein [Abyssibius alkaniclasticus]|tara:strand:- start:470 stop:934 length:465 start_codon:yes stop_codon:yes gene_type:complete
MSSHAISAVLFACDHNAVRSPMAEAIMKKFYGQRIYVQSAGVHHDMEVDGFAIAVCEEIGVFLEQHRSRSFEEMEQWGDDIDSYDLVIALSPAAQRHALEYTRIHAVAVEYWPIFDPTNIGKAREDKLAVYRQTRDQIIAEILKRFGPADMPND